MNPISSYNEFLALENAYHALSQSLVVEEEQPTKKRKTENGSKSETLSGFQCLRENIRYSIQKQSKKKRLISPLDHLKQKFPNLLDTIKKMEDLKKKMEQLNKVYSFFEKHVSSETIQAVSIFNPELAKKIEELVFGNNEKAPLLGFYIDNLSRTLRRCYQLDYSFI